MASFVAFLVAIDESTDITYIAQPTIFIRGVDACLTVTEEFVQLVPMTRMTKAEDIVGSVVGALDNVSVVWARTVSFATHVAPSMTGKKAIAKLKKCLLQMGARLWNFHCIIHGEALCCKSLKMDNAMEVAVKTIKFIHATDLNHRQFDNLPKDEGVSHGLPYHTEERWLS